MRLKKMFISAAAAALVLAACGSPDAAATTTAGPAPTTTAGPAPTTTADPVATTVAPVTTIAPTTTTSTTIAATTTTTTLPGVSTLTIRDNGLGLVHFGDSEQDVIAYLTGALGAPVSDTGWVDAFANFGVCPSDTARSVTWADPEGIQVFFFDSGTGFQPDGVPHFAHYWYSGPGLGGAGVATPDGITVGSTVAQAAAVYGASFEISESFIPGSYFWNVDIDPSDANAIGGWTTGGTDDSVLESIFGGAGCGE